MEYQKVKSVSKSVTTKGPQLSKLVQDTMKTISEVVGATLGPGGQQVLIERFEHDMPPIVTKDGVTVFRSLGFLNSTQQTIMESARDAAVRTASEAGDGPQPLWSKILTPTGFIEMRDAKVGMEICGTGGSVQKIVGVFPKGKKEIVKISFEGGQVVECCEDHLWKVTTNYGAQKIVTVRQMEGDYKSKQGDGTDKYRYFVQNNIVEFSGRQEPLPLDPYLVGVLIGDGSLGDSGSIEISLGLNKKHVIEKLVLPEGLKLNVSYCEDKHYFRVKIQGTSVTGKTIRDYLELEQVGLRNTSSHTKLIPQSYLTSSRQSRASLLQGLIDTDGHINSRGLFEYSTVSEQLASDFKFLCRSLGKELYSRVKTRKEGDGAYSTRPIFSFSELKGNKYGHKVSKIERTGQFTDMQCIKVSNSDSLYITDDFIVTHNTTTATVLAEAIVRRTHEFCAANPRISPQRVVRQLEKAFTEIIEPTLLEESIKFDSSIEEGKKLMRQVAQVSANGDVQLANAVMECFELVGDEGNVTITEMSGPSHYEVEQINGYPIPIGFEDSTGKFYPKFINDAGSQVCRLEDPVFILYHGVLTDVATAYTLLAQVGDMFELLLQGEQKEYRHHNVVFVAVGFSELVLGTFGAGFQDPRSLKIFPLVIPKSPLANSQTQFLQDLSAITGATIFDPINKPLDVGTLEDLGPGVTSFEASRFRSTIIGQAAERGEPWMTNHLEQVDVVAKQLESPESELDKILLQERMAKLTGGIAKLRVVGASNGELKEKRDRAEDAVCSVREAIKHGCLPGGGWGLLKASSKLDQTDAVMTQVLIPSLLEPVTRLLSNCGMTSEEVLETISPIIEGIDQGKRIVFDAMENRHGDVFEIGVFDALSAVLEAIRNSLSIASLLGTLGGTVVFVRDQALERTEARETQEWLRSANVNEANERQ